MEGRGFYRLPVLLCAHTVGGKKSMLSAFLLMLMLKLMFFCSHSLTIEVLLRTKVGVVLLPSRVVEVDVAQADR